VAALVATVLIGANTRPELALDRFLSAPSDGIRWLVTLAWILGFFGILGIVAAMARLALGDHVPASDGSRESTGSNPVRVEG
jgi:hypothetical protein